MGSTHRPCVTDLALAAFALGALLAGCSQQGPTTGEVQGKVTFKGKPVTEGTVEFLNANEGGAAGAEINRDGSYALNGPIPIGEYLIVITPLIEVKDTDPGKSPPAPVEKYAPNIPQKYRMPGTTTLKAKVEPGKNVVDLNMLP